MKPEESSWYYIIMIGLISLLFYSCVLHGCVSKSERDYYSEPWKTDEYFEYMEQRESQK